jgi:hypothetical protein
MRSLVISTPHSILCSYEIEKNEIGGACSTYGGGERRVQGIGEEN